MVLNRNKDAANYSAADILTGELYNLKEDPNEWNDLYGENEMEPVKQEFTFKLIHHLKSI